VQISVEFSLSGRTFFNFRREQGLEPGFG